MISHMWVNNKRTIWHGDYVHTSLRLARERCFPPKHWGLSDPPSHLAVLAAFISLMHSSKSFKQKKKIASQASLWIFFMQHFSNLQVLPLRFTVRAVSEVCTQWNWLGKRFLGITVFCDLGRKPPENHRLTQMTNLIMHKHTFILHNWNHR